MLDLTPAAKFQALLFKLPATVWIVSIAVLLVNILVDFQLCFFQNDFLHHRPAVYFKN